MNIIDDVIDTYDMLCKCQNNSMNQMEKQIEILKRIHELDTERINGLEHIIEKQKRVIELLQKRR